MRRNSRQPANPSKGNKVFANHLKLSYTRPSPTDSKQGVMLHGPALDDIPACAITLTF
jgi:hypothetical protein